MREWFRKFCMQLHRVNGDGAKQHVSDPRRTEIPPNV